MNNRPFQFVFLLTGFFSLISFLGGCSRHGEVSFQSGGVTETMTQGKIALRRSFPLPIYPKAQPSGSLSASDNQVQEDNKFLMLFTKDALDAVGSFYKQQLSLQGWKIKSIQSYHDMLNIAAQKNNLEAGVMLTRQENKTTISLSVSRSDNNVQLSPQQATAQQKTSSKFNPPDD